VAQSLSGRSVLEGAFALLEAVSTAGQSGLTNLASHTGLPKTTAYRLLEQLVELGAVERNSGSYRMGARVFRLGQGWQPYPGLLAASKVPVRRLSNATGASIGICVLREGQTMTVAGIPGEVEGLVSLRPSEIFPWTTAAGKLLVAHARPGLPLDPLPGAWDREADQIRERGLAVDRQELVPGVCCVAAPICDRRGQAVAALCALMAPSPQLSRLQEAVVATSMSISADLR
jgi:IclR family transcriptional regulator, acetate operon repressor